MKYSGNEMRFSCERKFKDVKYTLADQWGKNVWKCTLIDRM